MRTIRLLLLALLILAIPATSFAQFVVSVDDRSASTTCLHATHGPRRRLFMDARLLGLWE